MAIGSVTILGTGLIGTSLGLALRRAGFSGGLIGIDRSAEERQTALGRGAFSEVVGLDAAMDAARGAEVVVLATPVLGILDWMERLAPMLGEGQLVTDVGSTKAAIAASARRLFGRTGRAAFLPGHPMAGKESGGAGMGDATLFEGAMWLWTPVFAETEQTAAWRAMVASTGARTRDLEPERHDELCAWVSHLPQFVSTALASLLEERFGGTEGGMADVDAIGGRALRETTRLGASPYSMWRDIAMTNEEAIAGTLSALEQRLQHLRENLRSPELRAEFAQANRFRQGHGRPIPQDGEGS